MNSQKLIVLALGCLVSASCSTLRNAGSQSAAAIKNTTTAAISKVPNTALTSWLPGQHPKVVEVKERSLKPMPTGHELAMAHKRRGLFAWITGGPIDFEEPTLPAPGEMSDGNLLPPRMP
jgi:hypothetical protein